ncbi:MAG: DNA alkylation repair protein [Spirochaetales bacterium]|nr:DNA alkylation repair protein [Spirochaetales bacterium]
MNNNRITESIISNLRQRIQPAKKPILQRFFKTGPGQYAEGDVFWGIPVPQQREVVKSFFQTAGLSEINELLSSDIHECRLTALLLMVEQFKKATEGERQARIELYIQRVDRVNNWDLVDASAPGLFGVWFQEKDPALLSQWAQSGHLWKQRIAMVSTLTMIRKGRFTEALQVAELLVHHQHDLLQKAVGWMLREIGKQDKAVEVHFLERHASSMPRTMLRYAIEKFSPEERALFMLRPVGGRPESH